MSFRNDVFGRPGVIAATSAPSTRPSAGARGADGVLVDEAQPCRGNAGAPTDAGTVAAGITEIVDKAVAATECSTPVIVLNELNSAASTTPWTPTNDRYRANVLEVLQGIAARGGHPLLLLSARPYTGGTLSPGGSRSARWRTSCGRSTSRPRRSCGRVPSWPAGRCGRSSARAWPRYSRPASRGSPRPRDRLPVGAGKGGREGLQPTTSWLRFASSRRSPPSRSRPS